MNEQPTCLGAEQVRSPPLPRRPHLASVVVGQLTVCSVQAVLLALLEVQHRMWSTEQTDAQEEQALSMKQSRQFVVVRR